ncbi:hypothetical protein BGZ80_004343, partial [Entomortierella chlamydospora]
RIAKFEGGRVLSDGARHNGAEVNDLVVSSDTEEGGSDGDSGKGSDRSRKSTNNGLTKILASADRVRVDGHARDIQIRKGGTVDPSNLCVGNSDSNECCGSSEELHGLELDMA